MPHLDEGTLHALLDGELESTEVMEIQAHLGSCASCGSRLKDIREFMGEADRLLASVDLPRSATQAAAAAASVAPPPPEPLRPARQAPARGLASSRPLPPPDRFRPLEEPPVLLIPDNPDQIELKRRWLHGLGWVASVGVAVGLGFMVSQARHAAAPVPVGPGADARQAQAPSNAVVSTEETPRPDSAGAQSTAPPRDSSPPAAVPRAAAVAKSSVPKRAKPAENKPAEEQSLATRDEVAPAATGAVQDSQPADSLASGDSAGDSTSAGREDPGVIRARAAQALAELDRERVRSRAAAATAALDAQERARAVQAPVAAAPAPPPPTLEQRSRIYLRIGLDEAARQLGGPAHVIEGLNPSFMGLAQGGLSPGADTTRPVVRVVYQDSQGRMILLDQQRVRPGQAPATRRSNTPIWTVDDVVLHLQGEVGPETLRNLQPRVR